MADEINGINVDSTNDPSIQSTVNFQSGQSNAGVAQGYSQPGQEAAQGLLNRPDNYNKGLNYGDAATSAAIKQKYMGQYNIQNNALSLETTRNATADQIHNLSATTQAAGQEVEQNRQKALLKWNVEQQNKRARGAILGNVLGIVGAVGGGVAGAFAGGVGAPAGAAAGYALGQGAGNMIGGGY